MHSLIGTFGRTALLGLTVAAASLTAAHAQSNAVREANAGRLGLLSDSSVGTAVQVADEIARTLDGRSNLRVVQYISSGSVKNIRDLQNFRFADMAIVNSDALIAERLREPDNTDLESIKYLARLYTSELHVVVRSDAAYDTIYDLAGQNVSIGENGSGTSLTSRLVLRSLGVSPRAVELPLVDGLASLKRGELDAVFVMYGKPNSFLRSLDPEDGLRLLEVPLTDELAAIYRPAEFTGEDYPALVADKLTQSIAVDVVLAIDEGPTLGRDDRERLVSFVSELANNQQILANGPGHHAKWSEFTFDIDIPRWEQADLVGLALGDEEPVETNSESIFDVMQSLDNDG